MNENAETIEGFANLVFTPEKLKAKVDQNTYQEFTAVREGNGTLTRDLADKIAAAIKAWATENKATHYTHWFQPLTNSTAEKHNAFLSIGSGGKIISHFSGSNLIKDEVDASSFPSGGTRTTFEARGYTVWDITSPAFLKDFGKSRVLCIPSVYYSFCGDVLDKKTPLIRSIDALKKQTKRVLSLLGIEAKEVAVSLGAEQEYFLIDKNLAKQRQDIIFCGRTIFGAPAPKMQEKSGQYFAALSPRVARFMEALNTELWQVGIPAKTQHNETAPSQAEIVPLHLDANITADQNQLLTETMQKVAYQHDLFVVLHEKPFKGLSGSGKHCNWSISYDGKNIFSVADYGKILPQFLIFFLAVVAAVHENQEVLMSSATSFGNDLRLGEHEAPPRILSIFAGNTLSNSLDFLLRKNAAEEIAKPPQKEGALGICFEQFDNDDRNRTSPLAFTGSKFEFRLVGGSQSVATPVTYLNALTAQKLSEIAEFLESQPPQNRKEKAHLLAAELYEKHRDIIFNGNNYSKAWIEEAAARGLKTSTNFIDTIGCLLEEKTVKLFKNTNIFTAKELAARHQIKLENYVAAVTIEAATMQAMATREIVPTVIRWKCKLLSCVAKSLHLTANCEVEKEKINEIDKFLSPLHEALKQLEQRAEQAKEIAGTKDRAVFCCDSLVPLMDNIRYLADNLEKLVPKHEYPFPTYADLLFSVEN